MFKYLFKALLTDGTIIEQTQEDKSASAPDKNAFFDVLQQINSVRAFAIYNQETGDEYLVDLLDGHFEANQKPFFLTDEETTKKRLIFFKRNTLNAMTGALISVTYHFGWQANRADGSNLQKTIIAI